jgi:hypothetical protein
MLPAVFPPALHADSFSALLCRELGSRSVATAGPAKPSRALAGNSLRAGNVRHTPGTPPPPADEASPKL